MNCEDRLRAGPYPWDEKTRLAVADVVEVARELRSALARERVGGTPLSRSDYFELHARSGTRLARLDGLS